MNTIQNTDTTHINWENIKGSKLYMKQKIHKYNYITFNHTTFNIKKIDVNINSIIEKECKNIHNTQFHNNNHITWLDL